MKKTTKIASLFLAASIAVLSACATPEQRLLESGAKPLTDDALRSVFATESRGAVWKSAKASGAIRYEPDGTQYVTWNGGEDTGVYTIRDGKICGKWKTIRDGAERCSTVYRKAEDVYDAFFQDGRHNVTLTFQ
jgi:hypothetical protein